MTTGDNLSVVSGRCGTGKPDIRGSKIARLRILWYLACVGGCEAFSIVRMLAAKIHCILLGLFLFLHYC